MPNQKLAKKLGLIDVFCVASGAMISSGIFILPGLAHGKAGPAVIVSYLLAGFLALTGILSQAELVSAMPKAGGTYFYVTRSMGPAIGAIDGFLTWSSLCLKSSFALVGMAAFTNILFEFNIQFIAISLCVIFVLLNIVGIKQAGRVQIALVISLFGLMILYVILGIPNIQVEYFKDFASKGIPAVFSTAGFVFVSFGGVLKIASIAEEVEEPGKVIPQGMILSLLTVGTLYILVIFVTSGVLGASSLDGSLTPISDGAMSFMGQGGMILLSIAAILAFVSTANSGIMAASRYPLALSRDGLLPNIFKKINSKFQTPHIAILTTGAIMIFSLFFTLDILVEAASTVMIMTYLFSCIAVIIMRVSGVQNYRPRFRSPIYPVPQIAGLFGFGFLLFEMGIEVLIIIIILISSALIAYLVYGRQRMKEEYALLYLIEKITAKELTTHSLEDELKNIIKERDKIQKDRFDKLIEQSHILDLKEKTNLEEFFKLTSKKLSQPLDIPEEKLYQLLLKREKESTTAINPNIAIPHIIIEGQKHFNILLARCKEGIEFGKDIPEVKAVFVLVGTRDERNFHLRALASIAQIISAQDFLERWLNAKNIENLRDTILLGERKRQT
jgi:amino acid transporter/mannitol/fructose-specific phosphotransferase system IIA component (Ntr-type)